MKSPRCDKWSTQMMGWESDGINRGLENLNIAPEALRAEIFLANKAREQLDLCRKRIGCIVMALLQNFRDRDSII